MGETTRQTQSIPCPQILDPPGQVGSDRMELRVIPEILKGQARPRVVFDHGKVEESVLDRGSQVSSASRRRPSSARVWAAKNSSTGW
jgi:hypothetical protein